MFQDVSLITLSCFIDWFPVSLDNGNLLVTSAQLFAVSRALLDEMQRRCVGFTIVHPSQPASATVTVFVSLDAL